ncbi:C39 family peptidase [Leptolinea tardivitalis]|uniref:Peptidase C39-like domain-containing protein n=1 Tax=Leptolinea tardivitalis TaxID=229920 RepID=A0A0N8GL89_9CHLR|nr:C39 family peptidase [Leptolinea tardivitalis]KPL71826.1 hypothetical protein ADM99_10395 [Leptolinea tardivitalis]
MNGIKSWQWLIIAAGLFMTLICIVFAAFLTIQNINQSVANRGEVVVQAAAPNNSSQPTGIKPTKTPFLPIRFPTSISLLFHPTPTPVPTLQEPILPPQNEHDPALDFPPESFMIEGVPSNPQWFTLDCEARTAVDWAAFFGTSIDENEFLGRIPHSDNPDIGFVGRYDGVQGQLPPNSYGVHADPVANLLNEFGVSARSGKGFSWDDIRAEIASSRPVIAWVIYNTVPGNPIQYQDSDGNITTVAYYEHTVIVYGYTPNTVYIADNGRYYERTLQVFLASWSALNNMAIMAGN